jgi:hypothetical protein
MAYYQPDVTAFAASLLCAAVFGVSPSPANAQTPSNYQSSCNRISISGATLLATCRRVDGSFNRTSVVLQGIENVDGQLQFTQPGQPASYPESCQHIRIIGSTLTATCRLTDGSYQRSSINVPGISNVDGNLQYRP